MMTCHTELRDSIVEAVKTNIEGKDVAVACSGGLDSGLVSALAKRYARSVTLYTCGTSNAFDVAMAKDLSEKIGLPWNHVQISKSNICDMISELALAGDTDDAFTISYELQLFSVCMAAKEDIVLSGQGSDEYFMGCAKFVGASDDEYAILVETAKQRLNEISVPCEKKIAKHFGKTLIYPYLEDSVRSKDRRHRHSGDETGRHVVPQIGPQGHSEGPRIRIPCRKGEEILAVRLRDHGSDTRIGQRKRHGV
jgi:asparagine synthase (glutamine-hydrolysing)